MYGIFTYIYHKNDTPNVGEYTLYMNDMGYINPNQTIPKKTATESLRRWWIDDFGQWLGIRPDV